MVQVYRMKSELPKALIIGLVALVVVVIVFFAYTSFAKGPAQTDPTKVPADRLLDPDKRGT